MDMKQSAFEKKCRKIADNVLGDDLAVEFNGIQPYRKPFQDDGSLFIVDRKTGQEAVFDIGQDTPMSQYNEMTRAIMTSLGLKEQISDDVLTTMNPDEECCSECGRPW